MNRHLNATASIVVLLLATLTGAADAPDKAEAKNPAFEAIKALTGTWVATKSEPGQKPQILIFKPTSGDSAIVETMFPGSEHEMLNVYAADTQGVTLTHYCHMGNQPRMRSTAVDNGVLQFQFVDGGNLKSRDEAHMDSVEITIKDGVLVEKWAMYKDGKVTGTHTFEFKRQK